MQYFISIFHSNLSQSEGGEVSDQKAEFERKGLSRLLGF